MNIIELTPQQALNKAYLKVTPTRLEIDRFKKYLTWLLDQIKEGESEEFHKNLLADFLKNTYYTPDYFINTKGRNDLVIHMDKTAASTVGVIMEVKRPGYSAEMLRRGDINVKAFHELLLYYLRERVIEKNLALTYLVITNIHELYVFDASIFEQIFIQDKVFVKQFMDFEAGRLSSKSTEFFYQYIAQPKLASLNLEIALTYIDIRIYEPYLRSTNKADDKALIALFKLFSPQHLLKLPFTHDSNVLDKGFYNELLHILGLAETRVGQKILITRQKYLERDDGSLLENTIEQLDSLGKIKRLPNPELWGEVYEEQLFQVGLELVLTWVNRILFLKLLEGQLISYHQGDKKYAFLNSLTLPNFNRVTNFFFQVLARRPEERHKKIQDKFSHVPYLNSSLFEPTELEQLTIMFSNLTNDIDLTLFEMTVLRDGKGKRRNGKLNTLVYLFDFLNAYDFGSQVTDIQETNKPLINAAVLGLIFEKINGYQDGSFFTPGYVTMYMCRETLRLAVIEKFNFQKKWLCQTLDDVYNKITHRQEANEVVNSLRICDPAVGSGHFLVSALNEIIALKSELGILQDRQGRRLRDYQIEVVNDELVIFDENSEVVKYNPKNKESQRIQETIFHEKQFIIEQCLFGVDINSNSVNICRLRLWIELLKHAYYRHDGQLETLPNIDVNIKVGNSLVSRFPLTTDLRQILQANQWTIENYRQAIQSYQQATDLREKYRLAQFMEEVKQRFRVEMNTNHPKIKLLQKLETDLALLKEQGLLFEETEHQKISRQKQIDKLSLAITDLTAEIELIQNNPIYYNSLEWRFEFPQVLNEKGEFLGFDVVIGNPPYASMEDMNPAHRNYYYGKDDHNDILNRYTVAVHKSNLYAIFFERAISLTANNGFISLITPYSWLSNYSFLNLRKLLLTETAIKTMVFFPVGVFHDAAVATGITLLHKCPNPNAVVSIFDLQPVPLTRLAKLIGDKSYETRIPIKIFQESAHYIFNIHWREHESPILHKIESNTVTLGHLVEVERGCDTANNQKYIGLQEIVERHSKRLLLGQDLSHFVYHWQGWYLYYEPEKMKVDRSTARPGESTRFEQQEKLILSRFLDDHKQFICAYDDQQFYCLGSCYVLYPKTDISVNMKYLAGVLNSKLMAFYNGKLFSGIKVTRSEVLRVPIPINNELSHDISNKVTQIIELRKEYPAAATLALEQEVDQLIYRLYGLTESEIALVEASIPS